LLVIYEPLGVLAVLGSTAAAVAFGIGRELIIVACGELETFLDDNNCKDCAEPTIEECIGDFKLDPATILAFANGTVPSYCFYKEDTVNALCEDFVNDITSLLTLIVVSIVVMILAVYCGCCVCCARDEGGINDAPYAGKYYQNSYFKGRTMSFYGKGNAYA
jgi:hypothetical protein